MKLYIHTITLLFSLLLSTASAQSFSSNNKHVNLLELYTSEGCSSCPPADRWLSKLKSDPRLWTEFIPIAFHVDYWDYIGWKDPFASVQFSNRQRQYKQQYNLSSVYTPGLLLNGQEWRAWRKSANFNYPDIKPAGNLTVELSNQIISAHYQAADKQPSTLSLNIAILGFNVKSNINAGENNGHTFVHDFVVIGYHKITMTADNNEYNASNIKLPKLSVNPSSQAVVAWVNNANNLKPLQATGGWIETIGQ